MRMLTRISLGLAAACLAACTNMSGSNPLEVLGRKINLGLATEVPFLVPARNADAAALRSLTIVSSGQPLTQEVGGEVEALLLKLKIQEKDYYEKLNFTFHSAARSGLAAYCRELHAIGAIPQIPLVAPEVTDALAR